MLTSASHDEQAAVRQLKFQLITGRRVLEDEASLGPQRNRADDRIDAQLRLIVSVEADRVATIAIEVEEQAVPGRAGGCFGALFDGKQFGRPRASLDG